MIDAILLVATVAIVYFWDTRRYHRWLAGDIRRKTALWHIAPGAGFYLLWRDGDAESE